MGRRAHRHRRAVICADSTEAVRALRARAEPGCATGRAEDAAEQRLFTPDPELSGRALLDAVRTAWLDGAEVDWEEFYAGERRRRIPLPTYPFEGRRVWLEPPSDSAGADAVKGPHPLIGANVSTLAEHRYATTLTGDEFFVADHRVDGRAIMPAVGYLEMARAAGALSLPTGAGSLARVSFERPLSFPHGPRTVHVELTPHGDGARFTITDPTGTAAGEPEICARPSCPARPPPTPRHRWTRPPSRRAAPTCSPQPDLYGLLRARGLDYGPAMRSLRELRRGDAEALGVLELPPTPSRRGSGTRTTLSCTRRCWTPRCTRWSACSPPARTRAPPTCRWRSAPSTCSRRCPGTASPTSRCPPTAEGRSRPRRTSTSSTPRDARSPACATCPCAPSGTAATSPGPPSSPASGSRRLPMPRRPRPPARGSSSPTTPHARAARSAQGRR